MLGILDIGASGLKAQRLRLDTIAQNVANANTIADENGRANPYKRRFVIMAAGRDGDSSKPGVHVKEIGLDNKPGRKVYMPGHVLADKEGRVEYPNVDLPVEFVNAIEASRAYEANITMMETTKAMFNATLRLLA